MIFFVFLWSTYFIRNQNTIDTFLGRKLSPSRICSRFKLTIKNNNGFNFQDITSLLHGLPPSQMINTVDTNRIIYPILIALGSSTDNFTVGLTIGFKCSNGENMGTKRAFSWNRFNIVISTFNALGAWAACKGGSYTINQLGVVVDYIYNDRFYDTREEPEWVELSHTPGDISKRNIPSLLAGVAFSYLAFQELRSSSMLQLSIAEEQSNILSTCDAHVKRNSTMGQDHLNLNNSIQLAVPMTLNNLAGGVAGGAVGISAEFSFIMAFISSFMMMDIGFRIAIRVAQRYSCHDEISKKSGERIDGNMISGIIFTILASSQFWDYYKN